MEEVVEVQIFILKMDNISFEELLKSHSKKFIYYRDYWSWD